MIPPTFPSSTRSAALLAASRGALFYAVQSAPAPARTISVAEAEAALDGPGSGPVQAVQPRVGGVWP